MPSTSGKRRRPRLLSGARFRPFGSRPRLSRLRSLHVPRPQLIPRARARLGPRVRILSRARLLMFLAVLGPGLITASADNDAQGIATYVVAGSRTGYRLLWLLLLATISLVVLQEIGARLGLVTGKGLGALIRERYGVRVAAVLMAMLLVANLGTVAAEFAGIAVALEIFHVSKYVSLPISALLVFFLVVRGSYRRIERVFLVLTTLYLAYVVSGFLAHPAWGEALRSTVVPSFSATGTFLVTAVAVYGTTIAPWGQFFIQAYVVDKGLGPDDLPYERADVFAGSSVLFVVAFFVVLATAATIFSHGGSVETPADLAIALRPLAGRFASVLFGLGLLNASFLAAGILPLSTAYSICEALGFEMGLDQRMREAPVFYGVFAFAILFGAGIVMLPGAPLLPILLVSAAVNGVLLAPILWVTYRLANDAELMGTHRNGRVSNALTAATIVFLVVLTGVMLVTGILNPS